MRRAESSWLRFNCSWASAKVSVLTNGGNAHELYEELYAELLSDLAGITIPSRPEPLADAPPIEWPRYLGTYERASVKIDVREMDTRRSPNVWNLRAGDRITVNGSWAPNHDRFQAEMVRF